jgi:hypothetical protein
MSARSVSQTQFASGRRWQFGWCEYYTKPWHCSCRCYRSPRARPIQAYEQRFTPTSRLVSKSHRRVGTSGIRPQHCKPLFHKAHRVG